MELLRGHRRLKQMCFNWN